MMTRRTLVSIAMILVLVLCCIAGQAGMESADDGWISITVGDEKSEFSPEGIQLEIYLVATGNYGNWTMVDAFSDITVFTRSDGSASVDMTLGQIRQRIADRRIQPAAKGTSDKSGKVEFKNLPHGIYYTVMLDGPERLSMSPMLVAVPNRNGSIQVRAVAKYEYTTPTPSPTPAPKPTMTPFVTPVVTPVPQGHRFRHMYRPSRRRIRKKKPFRWTITRRPWDSGISRPMSAFAMSKEQNG